MQDSEFVENYFNQFTDIGPDILKTNRYYFDGLLVAYRDGLVSDLRMWEPGDAIPDSCVPFALIPEKQREYVTQYSALKSDIKVLKSFDLVLCKMHAGLGTSVDRWAHMKKYTSRVQLGSKGTDLFMEVDGATFSLAELQFLQMQRIEESGLFNSVRMLNLVNDETKNEVKQIQKKYSNDALLEQLKVPTINASGNLTSERLAPAGHGLIGFDLLLDIFKKPARNELITIGNGEDLNSTADQKILSWMAQEEIPIVMITTTKIECDKKGGQISRCTEGDKSYYTIVERAQAEIANQLEYFEELGLRKTDHPALFNTNIAVINTSVLKKRLEQMHEQSLEEFIKLLTPAVIKNTKEQDGNSYIQLEGALGSVLLNLDKFFRLNYDLGLVHFLNLNPEERGEFFIPIKKFSDFEYLRSNYKYDSKTGRFVKN